MMCTRRSLFGACVLALAGAGLSTGSASAQPASGFYLSQEIGLNVASAVALLGNSTDRASRCDEFINPRFAEVPGCTDPNRGSGAGWKTTYDRATGILAGLSAGYRFGGRLRVEAEWFHRESAYDQTSPVTSATGDTFAKLNGEIQRAEDRIGSISSQNVFANAYIDFPGRSRVTPYVGAGVGIGLTELDYGDLWARNPNPAAIGTAAGLPNEAEIRRNLAATTTSKQAELHDRLTRVPGVGRRGLRHVGCRLARHQGPLGSLRPLRRRRHRMGAPPEPRVGTTSRRQRAGDIPHPHRRRSLVRGRQLGYAVYVLIEQYGSPFVFPSAGGS